MILFEYFRLMLLVLPLAIFATFGLLVVVILSLKHAKIERIFKRILLSYCLSGAIASFLLLTYYYRPLVFERFDIVYAGAVIFAIVLLHHMLCYTIRFDKPFSILHYASVVVVCAVMWVCKLLFPELWAVEGITALLIVALVFGVVHSLFTLVRVYEHQMKLTLQHQVSDVLDKSKVVPFVVEVVLFPCTFAVCPLITGQDPGVLPSLVLMASILLALRMNIPLTYAMIRHYATPYNEASLLASDFLPDVIDGDEKVEEVVVEAVEKVAEEVVETETVDQPTNRRNRKYTKKNIYEGVLIEIDKQTFEDYFLEHKPYLNPNLTIFDLVESLESNRTYLSKFINRVYKMNFNRYLNHWRLREMEQLLALPENEGKTAKEMVKEAGFAAYRSYLRAIKMEEESEESEDKEDREDKEDKAKPKKKKTKRVKKKRKTAVKKDGDSGGF